jgi:hypothetical protein
MVSWYDRHFLSLPYASYGCTFFFFSRSLLARLYVSIVALDGLAKMGAKKNRRKRRGKKLREQK